MAIRRVYYLANNKVDFFDFEIKWKSGFGKKSRIENINMLHSKIASTFNVSPDRILEVSTNSENTLGRKLSSFNLELEVNGNKYKVESAYQSSKKFETLLGIKSFSEYIKEKPGIIKSKIRGMDPKTLIGFNFLGVSYNLNPKYMFYDWLYVRAIHQQPNMFNKLFDYDYFTDIEFNPEKSINCQARSVVLYIWLMKKSRVDEYIMSPGKFYANLI